MLAPPLVAMLPGRLAQSARRDAVPSAQMASLLDELEATEHFMSTLTLAAMTIARD
jgi:hypothetical protein